MRALCALGLLLALTGCLEPGGQGISYRDQDPPRVSQTDPAANGRVAKTGVIQITFSEPMDDRSLAPGIALLSGTQNVPLQVYLPPTNAPEPVLRGPFTVTVQPTAPLAGDAPYTLVLKTLLADTAGNPLPEEVRVGFFTLP